MVINVIWRAEFEITFTKELHSALHTLASIHYSSECKALIAEAEGNWRKNGLLEMVAQSLLLNEGPVKRTLSWRECDILLKTCEIVHHARVTDEFKSRVLAFTDELRGVMELSRKARKEELP
ncbi:hypothetical protein PQD74_gp065 [Stenotrophomonas phage Siara]|uniref:Uncharacterized protein n=1 Tax=Stenotrophomonas phage Siara TaxID=2859658 RepID=A0AAE7WMS2_9CAUD|nr:hypothetical protein PQD74_gp065 [Stenotrophomonas phage Siara]QYW02099.1 hypothetical protein CPT_Siara_099 [Stenotrophomonas phage Siara]